MVKKGLKESTVIRIIGAILFFSLFSCVSYEIEPFDKTKHNENKQPTGETDQNEEEEELKPEDFECASSDIKAITCPEDSSKIQKRTCVNNKWEDSGVCYKNPKVDVMVKIPTGNFWRGCNESVDKECLENEFPGKEIFLYPYEIDVYPVTAGEYESCIRSNNCDFNAEIKSFSHCNYGVPGKENHPMNCVSFQEAQAFCKWLGKRNLGKKRQEEDVNCIMIAVLRQINTHGEMN